MVVMVMRYNNSVNCWYIFYLTRDVCVALRPEPTKRATSLAEYGVEKDAEATREFDKVAGVAEPCCAEGGVFAGGEKGWFSDCDGWRCCVWAIVGAGDASPLQN